MSNGAGWSSAEAENALAKLAEVHYEAAANIFRSLNEALAAEANVSTSGIAPEEAGYLEQSKARFRTAVEKCRAALIAYNC